MVLSFSDVKRCTLTRNLLLQCINESNSKELVIGCFVYIGICSEVDLKSEISYKIGQILDVIDAPIKYTIDDTTVTNKLLTLLFLNQNFIHSDRKTQTFEWNRPLTAVSNRSIAEESYDEWQTALTPAPALANEILKLSEGKCEQINKFLAAVTNDENSCLSTNLDLNRLFYESTVGIDFKESKKISLCSNDSRNEIIVGLSKVENFNQQTPVELLATLEKLLNASSTEGSKIQPGQRITSDTKLPPIYSYLARYGLIANSIQCEKCQRLMYLQRHGGDIFKWTCSSERLENSEKKSCSSTRTIRFGSFFENFYLRASDFPVVLLGIFYWCQGMGGLSHSAKPDLLKQRALSNKEATTIWKTICKQYLVKEIGTQKVMGLSEQNIAEKFRNHVQQRYSTIYDGAMTFVHLHSKIAEDGSVISPISNTSIGEPASTNSQATKISSVSEGCNKPTTLNEDLNKTPDAILNSAVELETNISTSMDDDKEQSTTSRESSDRNVQQKDLPTSNAAIQPSFCEPTTVEPEHETSKSKSEEKLDKKNSEAGRKSRGAKRTTTTANESGAKAKKAKSDSQDRATIKSALAETNEGDKPNENGESSSDDTDKKRLELEKRLLEKYGFVMVEVAISNEPMIS